MTDSLNQEVNDLWKVNYDSVNQEVNNLWEVNYK
jgi:hypothetical protein